MKKRFLPLIFFLFAVFLASGCAPKAALRTTPAVLTIKSSALRFSETAFIREYEGEYGVQVYSAGRKIHDLRIEADRICLDGNCLDPEAFNRRFLSPAYPEGLVWAFFRGGELPLEGALPSATAGVQKFHKPGRYDALYQNRPGDRLFRDRLNGIVLRIKELE